MLSPWGFYKLWNDIKALWALWWGKDGNEILYTFLQYSLWKWTSGSRVNSREKGSDCSGHVPAACPLCEEQQQEERWPGSSACVTHWNVAQQLLFTSEPVTRRLEPSPSTCTAKRWSVINFVLPGQTLQHFPSTFWGYLQGYCSGQWIFLHSCLVMLQVHNTHSTIPKARRLGCQDSPCEYVLPFETQTAEEKKKKRKSTAGKGMFIGYLSININLIHAHLFKVVVLTSSGPISLLDNFNL